MWCLYIPSYYYNAITVQPVTRWLCWESFAFDENASITIIITITIAITRASRRSPIFLSLDRTPPLYYIQGLGSCVHVPVNFLGMLSTIIFYNSVVNFVPKLYSTFF